MKQQMIFAAILALSVCAAQAKCPSYKVLVFTDTSHNAAGLTKITQDYVKALGGMNNGNSPGPLPDGHRSVRELPST